MPAYIQDYGQTIASWYFADLMSRSQRSRLLWGVTGMTSHSTESNEEAMERWRSGAQRVMVSTSLLGCGLDYASVRHVIHCGIAYSMIDQHQQESRAGRDGQRAMAITYTRPTIQRTSKVPEDAYGLVELEELGSASSDQCLRVIPSSYLDGVPVTCLLLPGAELCCFCEGQVQLPPPARPRNSLKVHTRRCFYCQGSCYKGSCRPPPTKHTHPATKNPTKLWLLPSRIFRHQRSRRRHLL